MEQTLLEDELASQQAIGPPPLRTEQLVGGILEINTTAPTDFLKKFDDRDLKAYLDHLSVSSGPRGSKTPWVRESTQPAIVGRENQD